jgi:four helix bundle protein
MRTVMNTRPPVSESKTGIAERTFAYALSIVRLYQEAEAAGGAARRIGNQLFDSGTSVGANVEEAQGAQSKADFIAKMSIAHKETRESAFWLRLLLEAGLLPKSRLADLREETEVIRRIISSILVTSKRNVPQRSQR